MTLHYKIVTRTLYYYMKLFRRLEVQGLENIPAEGSIIFASNHISMLDPFVLAAVVKNKAIAMMAAVNTDICSYRATCTCAYCSTSVDR